MVAGLGVPIFRVITVNYITFQWLTTGLFSKCTKNVTVVQGQVVEPAFALKTFRHVKK